MQNNSIKNTGSSNRRKLLLGSIAAAGVAGKWYKPIVKSVVLPTHAQSSLSQVGQTPNCGRINIRLNGELTNEHTGGVFYVVYDENCNSLFNGSQVFPSTINLQFPIDLNPGTYLVAISSNAGGSAGSSNYTVSLGCCDDTPVAVGSVSVNGNDGGVADIFAQVTIGDDMSCSINVLPESQFACDAA